QLNRAKVRIISDQKILTVAADVGRAVAFQNVRVDASAMQIHHEDAAVPLLGKRSALVKETAGVCMAAADGEATRVDVADVRAAAEVVDVIADFADLAVVVGIEVLPRLADIAPAGDHVK